tara:strand:- start:16191 stop:16904 length:714 start_codon:yes stop_codon:yes gene_type:complete
MRFNWALLILFFTVMLSLAIIYMTSVKNGSRTLEKINITIKPNSGNNYFISADSIRNLVKSEIDLNVNSLNLSNLEKTMNKITYVKKSEVFKTVNNQLEIIVYQKEPIARIINSDSVFYLDKNSTFMNLSELYSVQVPLIFGFNKSSDLKFLTNISNMIKNDKFLNENISQIFIDKNQEVSLKLRGFNTIVEIGDKKNLNKKIQNLKAFYVKAFEKNEINQYKKLNLQYANQVIGIK